jgi:hypothetical protein
VIKLDLDAQFKSDKDKNKLGKIDEANHFGDEDGFSRQAEESPG